MFPLLLGRIGVTCAVSTPRTLCATGLVCSPSSLAALPWRQIPVPDDTGERDTGGLNAAL